MVNVIYKAGNFTKAQDHHPHYSYIKIAQFTFLELK